MYDSSFGPVLLALPSNLALDWALVAVGLALGLVVSVPPSPFYQPLCVGAAVLAISRDFDVPFDAALMACLPITLLRWTSSPLLQPVLVAGVVANYFVGTASPPVPTDSWAPALSAFLFVSRGPGKPVRVALVLARFLAPRGVHVLYGGLLFGLAQLEVPGYDPEMGSALAYSLCALLAREAWYGYLAAGIGSALALYPYIRRVEP